MSDTTQFYPCTLISSLLLLDSGSMLADLLLLSGENLAACAERTFVPEALSPCMLCFGADLGKEPLL